ncbi:quinol:cytochrome c oxidoreductase membrane protein [Fodinibius salinus]|uniref:Quinol:cytochrome c oxidoreductase membrane protein n=1 Tax=Fodinibius salinus TaxID=860790 RepID=A0A5D3YG65_9BACT|nr:DUF3341 domain-containing protein [Fodinibius salinus]TYP92673.1 quinol:cytochrome c oxidoreductase membrane protein [Fodinibius salinus]
MEADNRQIYGVLAEFRNPKELVDAAESVKNSGYSDFDTYAPFPIHGMEKAMGVKKSPLGWIVLSGALIGMVGALALMVWVMGYEYPMNISGKPFINIPIYVPITFELTVLLAAFAATFGMIGLNKLPRFNNPLFNVERFEKASDDGFFVCIEASDDLFAEEKAEKLFRSNGATHIETVYDSE